MAQHRRRHRGGGRRDAAAVATRERERAPLSRARESIYRERNSRLTRPGAAPGRAPPPEIKETAAATAAATTAPRRRGGRRGRRRPRRSTSSPPLFGAPRARAAAKRARATTSRATADIESRRCRSRRGRPRPRVIEPFRRAFLKESKRSFNRSKDECSLRMSAGSLDTARLSRATSFSRRARSRSARSRSILARAAACSLASRRAASDADRAAALRASARNRSTGRGVDTTARRLVRKSLAGVEEAARRCGHGLGGRSLSCVHFSFRARLWYFSRVDGVCGSV